MAVKKTEPRYPYELHRLVLDYLMLDPGERLCRPYAAAFGWLLNSTSPGPLRSYLAMEFDRIDWDAMGRGELIEDIG